MEISSATIDSPSPVAEEPTAGADPRTREGRDDQPTQHAGPVGRGQVCTGPWSCPTCDDTGGYWDGPIWEPCPDCGIRDA